MAYIKTLSMAPACYVAWRKQRSAAYENIDSINEISGGAYQHEIKRNGISA